ncbi:MAG: selenocysteine-specific translation elongation factor [Deltaproteobacteria bacterium]|nr:selenocysteine-specific translation elongation factor [Deltaproteobacteria bacterium]
MAEKHIILGTAGHVDHGKTTLVKALTGTDTDRLAEEKKRGITIELGFAHLTLPSGQMLGVIDVPGHERFIKNMVAGAGGIDLVLLLVAADEGVMPQTREHFDVCQLLGIKRGLVVISKCDTVDDELLELVTEEVADLVAGSFLEEAPVIAVSATTGVGLDKLLAALDELVQTVVERPDSGAFRLPVDRAFVIKGFGTVVTGTVLSGSLGLGDSVTLSPSGLSSRVRSLQAYGEERQQVFAGERAAINLLGLEKSEIERGEILARPETVVPTSMVDVYYSHLASATSPLPPRSKMLVHSGTAALMGTVVVLNGMELVPGSSAFVQVRLENPTVIVYGDRVVMRSFARRETVGGGLVINPCPAKHRLKEYAALLPDFERLLAGDPGAVVSIFVKQAAIAGLPLAALKASLNLSGKALTKVLDELLARREIVRFDNDRQLFIGGNLFAEQAEAIMVKVVDYHQREPLREGMPKEEVRSRLGLSAPLFHALLQRLVKSEKLVVDKDLLRTPDHRVRLAVDTDKLKSQLIALYRQAGLSFPDYSSLAENLAAEEDDIKTLMNMLVKDGTLLKVRDGIFLTPEHYESMRSEVVGFLKENGTMTTQEFKAKINLSRKYVIPLFEYLDQRKVTARKGEARILLQG